MKQFRCFECKEIVKGTPEAYFVKETHKKILGKLSMVDKGKSITLFVCNECWFKKEKEILDYISAGR